MSFSVLRLCPRLLFSVSRKPISRLQLKYHPVNQQRFCSALNDVKRGVNVDNFEEFEDIPSANELCANVDIDAIVGDDLEERKSLQIFITELNMLMQTQGLVAPKHMTTQQWQKLLSMKSEKFRVSYLRRLYYIENRRDVKATFQKEKVEDRRKFLGWKESRPAEPTFTSSPLTYGLAGTTLFHRVYKPVIKHELNFNLALAMIFGPDIVVDCSYEKYMRSSEIFGCARQILFMWSTNRECRNPFNIVFCNLNPEGRIMKHLLRVFHEIEGDCSLLNFTEKSYMDLYPAKELVYLTPHCEEELDEYDADSTYIIGAYVDEIINKPVSLAKAKRDGLRTAKFPLDKNLNWAQGSKLLPINQCLSIMNDLKDGAKWEYALRHVATRKQSFQICGSGNTLKISDKQAACSVRESVRRDMLRDLNLKQIYPKQNKGTLNVDDV